MSDLYEKIAGQRGGFEKLLVRIPGFRGYIEKASRRTADRMLRDYIARQLTARVDQLVQIERTLLSKDGGMSYMGKTSSVKTKLQTFRDRVKAAAPGYSGFMEALKVDEEMLDRLYAFDEAIARYADQFEEALSALQSAVDAGEGIESAIAALDSLTLEANEAFSLRENVLTDLDKSLS